NPSGFGPANPASADLIRFLSYRLNRLPLHPYLSLFAPLDTGCMLISRGISCDAIRQNSTLFITFKHFSYPKRSCGNGSRWEYSEYSKPFDTAWRTQILRDSRVRNPTESDTFRHFFIANAGQLGRLFRAGIVTISKS